jgi:hypothetical protein
MCQITSNCCTAISSCVSLHKIVELNNSVSNCINPFEPSPISVTKSLFQCNSVLSPRSSKVSHAWYFVSRSFCGIHASPKIIQLSLFRITCSEATIPSPYSFLHPHPNHHVPTTSNFQEAPTWYSW